MVPGSFVPRDTRLGTRKAAAPIPPLLTQYNLFGGMTKHHHGNGYWRLGLAAKKCKSTASHNIINLQQFFLVRPRKVVILFCAHFI